MPSVDMRAAQEISPPPFLYYFVYFCVGSARAFASAVFPISIYTFSRFYSTTKKNILYILSLHLLYQQDNNNYLLIKKNK